MWNFKTVIANLHKWKCGEVSFLFAKIIEHTEVEKNLIDRCMYCIVQCWTVLRILFRQKVVQ